MKPTWKPPVLRESLSTVAEIKLPNTPTTGHRIERVTVDYTGFGAAVWDYNHPSVDDVMQDVRIICRAPSPVTNTLQHSKWGVRRYKVAGLRRRLWISGVWKEHPIYESPYIGPLEYVDCLVEDSAAQGLQLRHTGNRSDMLWGERRLIRLKKFRSSECGQARGVGRAGFSISIKDMGPQTDVEFNDVWVRTINQDNVVTKNGKQYDSFGGVAVEYCRTFKWNGGYVGMRNPDRQPVQLLDYAQHDPETAGPENVVISGVHVDYGGNILVHEGADTIDIRRCKGDGRLQFIWWDNDRKRWETVRYVPISQGFQRGG